MQNRLNTFILYKYYIELKYTYIYILYKSILLYNHPFNDYDIVFICIRKEKYLFGFQSVYLLQFKD